MDVSEALRDLARNLYWTWHPEIVTIFRDLDPQLWRETTHSPRALVERLSDETIRRKASELNLESRIDDALAALQSHVAAEETWGAVRARSLRAFPVAYFSAEFGLHESLPIYSGGLGVLAGDHLKSASDLGVPLVGVGLFYTQGYFAQTLNRDGWQQEHYFSVDLDTAPIERATGADGQPLKVAVDCRDSRIWATVWTAHVGRCRMVLLDTNTEENSETNKALTAQLYGGGDEIRIRQELVLGVGGYRALLAMGIHPGVIHLNEGHSAFAVLERARLRMEGDGRSFQDVREATAASTVFTTHTPVEAGHDRFHPNLTEQVLGPLRESMGISHADLMELGRVDPKNRDEPFCMTTLGLKMSRHRNGVSALHGRVTQKMWHGLWPNRFVEEVPIGQITNGIHIPSWLSAPMDSLLKKSVGEDWQAKMDDPQAWAAVRNIDDEEMWANHGALRERLVEYMKRRIRRQAHDREEPDPVEEGHRMPDPAVLTIGFARRFATYKRADLIFRDIDRLDALVNHPERPIQLVFAGKAHPADEGGKKLIQKIFRISRDPRFAGRVVFLENHDMNVERHIIQGTDVWLNNPRRPYEACGTSGQKAVVNGGVNVSVLDGWWAQGYDGTNGFAIGTGGEHSDPERQAAADCESLYQVLENDVIPMFYERDEDGLPRRWIAMQKHALESLAYPFSARRMTIDYVRRCYLPAAGASTAEM